MEHAVRWDVGQRDKRYREERGDRVHCRCQYSALGVDARQLTGAAGSGAAWGTLTRFTMTARRLVVRSNRPVRPPGAAARGRFGAGRPRDVRGGAAAAFAQARQNRPRRGQKNCREERCTGAGGVRTHTSHLDSIRYHTRGPNSIPRARARRACRRGGANLELSGTAALAVISIYQTWTCVTGPPAGPTSPSEYRKFLIKGACRSARVRLSSLRNDLL